MIKDLRKKRNMKLNASKKKKINNVIVIDDNMEKQIKKKIAKAKEK